MNSLSQKFNNFMYQTFYSDSTKNQKFDDDSIFTFRIVLWVQIFRFLSAKLFELRLEFHVRIYNTVRDISLQRTS